MKKKEIWLTNGKDRTVRIHLEQKGGCTLVTIYDSATAYSEEEEWKLPLPRVEKILREFYREFGLQ